MSIYFTNESPDTDTNTILFQFYDRELPEGISFGSFKTKVNHIEYPGGFQTNQIIGVYEKPIEWSGLFYGSYNEEGFVLFARERADQLKELLGRVVRVGFPQGGQGPVPGIDKNIPLTADKYGGVVGVYVIEDLDVMVKDLNYVEYTIRLVPHQRQEKIKPDQTTSIAIKVNFSPSGPAHAAGRRIAGRSRVPGAPSNGNRNTEVMGPPNPNAPFKPFSPGLQRGYNRGRARGTR